MSKNTVTNEVVKAEKGMNKCIETMKEKQFEVNFKCSQNDALVFAIGATAVLVGAHIVMGFRKKAKIKKQLAKKYEKKCEKEVEKRVKLEIKELAKAADEEAK